MTDEPNGSSLVSALEPGETVFLDEGAFVVQGFPQQVEAGEIWVEAAPVENLDDPIVLMFSDPDRWVQIRREVPCR